MGILCQYIHTRWQNFQVIVEEIVDTVGFADGEYLSLCWIRKNVNRLEDLASHLNTVKPLFFFLISRLQKKNIFSLYSTPLIRVVF